MERTQTYKSTDNTVNSRHNGGDDMLGTMSLREYGPNWHIGGIGLDNKGSCQFGMDQDWGNGKGHLEPDECLLSLWRPGEGGSCGEALSIGHFGMKIWR